MSVSNNRLCLTDLLMFLDEKIHTCVLPLLRSAALAVAVAYLYVAAQTL